MRISNLFILIAVLFNSAAFAKGDQAYCSQYAQTAVKQYQQNLQQQCGYSGLRWSDNKVGQMQWCLTVDEAITANENQVRQRLLDSCRSRKNSNTSRDRSITRQVDNSTYCAQYAQTAVDQYQQNQQRQCGFEGSRWSNDKEGQMQWCMAVSVEITARENQARQRALASCSVRQKRPDTISKALRIKPFKSSTVQQLFPQKVVNTNMQKLGLKDLNAFLKKTRVPTYNFTLSHSGRWLAQGGDSTNDSTLKLWDLQQGKLLFILGEEKGRDYSRLVFSPDEKYLIAGNDETTDIWDWKKARLLFRLKDYFLPSFQNQVFDGNQKLYLFNEDRKSVSRFDLPNGLQEGKWTFAEHFASIRYFAVSNKGDIAVTVLKPKDVVLKVHNTQSNRLIYSESIPLYSIYNKVGNYPSGKLLGFIDNENIAFYHLRSLGDQAFISRLDLKTKAIETMRLADNSALRIEDIDPHKIEAKIAEKLCPSSTHQLGWKDINDVHCELKKQEIQNNHIVSSYEIKQKGRYLDRSLMLHDSKGNILAYFGADSNARWFWLDAQSGKLKNSGALWSDASNPNRKPNIYHFPTHTVPLKLNQKTTRQYPFPKADIHRLEVFMGADNTIKYKPTIKPSFGNYALSHNGRWLVVGSLSGEGISSFALWDLEKNTYVKSFQSKIAWSHSSLAFSPDDRYLVIFYGSTSGHYAPCMECSSVIDIWDLKTSQYKFSIPLLDRNNYTTDPVIFNNGDMYLNINNKVVQRWNIKRERFMDVFRTTTKYEEVFSMIGNGGDLLAISVEEVRRNPDDSLKSSKSWIEVWSISKQKIIQKINIMNKHVQGGLDFNTVFVSESKIAVATRLNDIIIWDALSGNKLKTLIPTKKEFGFTYQLSSEGNGILISSAKFVQRWDISTGALLKTINACQPDMPGLPVKRYAQLKEYHGSGSAKVAAGKVVSAYSCPQGGRSKVWDMRTGESKALFGKDYKGEWFWLNDQEELKSTLPPPPAM